MHGRRGCHWTALQPAAVRPVTAALGPAASNRAAARVSGSNKDSRGISSPQICRIRPSARSRFTLD
jgi:hypothetical protein